MDIISIAGDDLATIGVAEAKAIIESKIIGERQNKRQKHINIKKYIKIYINV